MAIVGFADEADAFGGRDFSFDATVNVRSVRSVGA
jgi:hypothetical protein